MHWSLRMSEVSPLQWSLRPLIGVGKGIIKNEDILWNGVCRFLVFWRFSQWGWDCFLIKHIGTYFFRTCKYKYINTLKSPKWFKGRSERSILFSVLAYFDCTPYHTGCIWKTRWLSTSFFLNTTLHYFNLNYRSTLCNISYTNSFFLSLMKGHFGSLFKQLFILYGKYIIFVSTFNLVKQLICLSDGRKALGERTRPELHRACQVT